MTHALANSWRQTTKRVIPASHAVENHDIAVILLCGLLTIRKVTVFFIQTPS